MTDNIRNYVDTYEALLARVQQQHARLRDEHIPRVAALLTVPIGFPLPPDVQGTLQETVRSALQTLHDLVARIDMHLKSGPLVVRLYINAGDWVLVSTTASEIVGDLRAENRPVRAQWRGLAADAYEQAVVGQVAAATHLRVAAQAISFALNWVAMAALTLYVGLLALLVQLSAIIVGAILAYLSGVGIPAALAAFGAAIPALAIQITGLLVVAAESYARARIFLDDMRAKALERSAFPNGSWPHPDPARYNDATVSDGDPTDWTVAG